MVAIRIGDISVRSLDDEAYGQVLAAVARAGGASSYPLLVALPHGDTETDAPGLLNELARLGGADGRPEITLLLGQLRDDLMEALSVASEG
jgi:hypothetical protein